MPEELIELLRRYKGPHPFDDVVADPGASPEAIRGFVPHIYRDHFETIVKICERKSDKPLEQIQNLHRPSRVLFVFGGRGAGKTFLVNRLRISLRQHSILSVVPTSFSPSLSFTRYLLGQLVAAALHKDNRDLLIKAITSFLQTLVLRRLRSLDDVRWLRWCRKKLGFSILRQLLYHWGFRTRRLTRLRHEWIQRVEPRSSDFLDWMRSLPPRERQWLSDLARERIRSSESSVDLYGAVRSGLYLRLVDTLFASDADADNETDAWESLTDYLNDGFLQEYRSGVAPPEGAVDALLDSLIVFLAFQGVPIAVLFDALDSARMLGGENSERLFQTFFEGLADFLDHHPGITFIVFLEQGFWENRASLLPDFAMQRLHQGVSNPDGGQLLHRLDLRIDLGDLQDILLTRLRPLHEWLRARVEEDSGINIEVPKFFPFSDEVLTQFEVQERPTFRDAILTFRHHYDEIIERTSLSDAILTLGEQRTPSPPVTAPANLEEIWERISAETEADLEPNLSSRVDDFIAATKALFAELPPESGCPGFEHVDELSGTSSYERFVTAEVTTTAGRCKLALGYLLGYGAGLPADVKKKLTFWSAESRAARADLVVVLYPGRNNAAAVDNPLELLSPKAKSNWEELRNDCCRPVYVRVIQRENLRDCLAAGEFLKKVQEISNVPKDRWRQFLRERLQSFLEDAVPSRTTAKR